MYDLIGDIHGHADELVFLLEQMGYDRRSGVYAHPQRRAVFVGDLIDRGPKIPEVLRIVRGMVEAGHALCVMGNHEFNALAYHTRHPDDPSRFLRNHDARGGKTSGSILKPSARSRPASCTIIWSGFASSLCGWT